MNSPKPKARTERWTMDINVSVRLSGSARQKVDSITAKKFCPPFTVLRTGWYDCWWQMISMKLFDETPRKQCDSHFGRQKGFWKIMSNFQESKDIIIRRNGPLERSNHRTASQIEMTRSRPALTEVILAVTPSLYPYIFPGMKSKTLQANRLGIIPNRTILKTDWLVLPAQLVNNNSVLSDYLSLKDRQFGESAFQEYQISGFGILLWSLWFLF